jgi:hypothetical protein
MSDSPQENYAQEKWITLYEAALLELKQALMAGRIMEARTEIVKRVEHLEKMPGLQPRERRSIADALNGLRSLEREEARRQREAAELALQELAAIAPVIHRVHGNPPPSES